MQQRLRLIHAVFICCLLSACSGDAPPASSSLTAAMYEVGGPTMGTRWRVMWVSESEAAAVSTGALSSTTASTGAASTGAVSDTKLSEAIVAELDRINGLMSTWDPDSQLSVFNRTASIEPMVLHEDTLTVIDTALSISRLTGGKYDITLQPVIDLWGFGGSDNPVTPDQAAIDQALRSTGYRQIVRVNDTARKRVPGLSVDVSSLAKGFAVDRLGEIIESLGINDYLVDIGGELRARGHRADGKAWRVGIESPEGGVPQILNLLNTHIATSGSYRNYRVENGQRLSHIIDGETGRPITHDVVSVSVVHESAMLADAWATALMVVGRESALMLVEQQGLAAQLVWIQDGQFQRLARNGFSEMLVSE